jgi:drug/metabolite transporter superfamily protein YnfA
LPVFGVGLLLACYLPVLAGHLRFAFDPWQFADDVRVLIHPQFRWEDPAAFPNDPVVAYYLASLPDGYRLLYVVLGPLLGVEFLSKLLPYPLLLLTLGAVAAAAHRLSGLAAALGALALGLGSAYLLGRMAGGLPRSFALPLLAWGAFALVFGRVKLLAGLVVVSAAFYPMAGVVLGAAFGLLLLLPARDRGAAAAWSWQKRSVWLALTALGALLVLMPSALRLREYGDAIPPELWAQYPEAGPGGRFDAVDRAPFPGLPDALYPPLLAALVGVEGPLVAWTNLSSHLEWLGPAFAMLLLASYGVLAWTASEGRRLTCLLGAVVLCHSVAFFANLRLFLPERYVAYGVPVLALVGIPALFAPAAKAARRALRALPYAFNSLLLALVGAEGSSFTGLTVGIPPSERGLYAKLSQLPSDAVVAGWPGEAIDNVPYLSRRSAFVTRETHMPFHRKYTELMRQRTLALIRAYFASSPEALRDFRRQSGVTHLLIDGRHFLRRPGYFVPFDAPTALSFDAMQRDGSAALAARSHAQVFEHGPYVVLDLSRL